MRQKTNNNVFDAMPRAIKFLLMNILLFNFPFLSLVCVPNETKTFTHDMCIFHIKIIIADGAPVSIPVNVNNAFIMYVGVG